MIADPTRRIKRRARASLLAASLLACAQLAAQAEINSSLIRPLPTPKNTARATPLRASVRAASPAVVHVHVEIRNGRNTFKVERPSSGIVVDPQGLVLTLWSLVREGVDDKLAPRPRRKLRIQLRDGKLLEAKLLARDVATGLALLGLAKAPAEPLAYLECANAGAALPGSATTVMSFHDGKEPVAFAGVLAHAIGGTTIDGQPLAAKDILLTDAAIQTRSHGAALVDSQRRLLGICSAEHVAQRLQEPTLADFKRPSFGFAIPIDTARRVFAKALREAKPKNRTLLVAPKQDLAPEPSAAAVARVAKSIVGVWSGSGKRPGLGTKDPYATQRRAGLGSGVIVSSSGLVLTNSHLLSGRRNCRVTTREGKTYTARVLDTKGKNSALLQVDLPAGVSLPAIRLASSKNALFGETVLAVGNPYGNRALTISIGVLSAKRGSMLQADPNIHNDNAGGALIDLSGRLLGVIDGGRMDKADLAWLMRGDQAKLNSNLSLVAGIDLLRTRYSELVGLEVAAESESDKILRRSPTVSLVERTARGLINVYVSQVLRGATDEDNPFAPPSTTRRGLSLGSGVVIDGSGLALTNWHVVDAATDPDGTMRRDHAVEARLRDGSKFEVEVLSISREDDLALVKLKIPEGQSVTPIVLGDSDHLQLGEPTIAIGNPMGQANTVTKGIVSALDRSIRVKGRWAKFNGLVETDAAINGGNSGGGLLDADGRLIGINSAGGRGLETTSYAIPVNYVRSKTRNVLLSPEKLRSAYVGMHAGEDAKGRLIVSSVATDGPAADAGIKNGDRLVALEGKPLRWSVGLALRLRKVPTDRPIVFAIERDGKRMDKKIKALSASVWAVRRQIGVEVSKVMASSESELVRAACTAMHRQYTGDPTAEPLMIQESVVRVSKLAPGHEHLQKDDLILGVELIGEDKNGALLRFKTAAEVQACFNKYSRYEGSRFRTWIYRKGKLELVQLPAKRLML